MKNIPKINIKNKEEISFLNKNVKKKTYKYYKRKVRINKRNKYNIKKLK